MRAVRKTKRSLRFPGLYSVVLLAAAALSAPAQNATEHPFVSPIFGDSMVLQRNKPNTIWGWSEPGDTVRVEIAGNTATATAGADGKWQARVQPPAMGGPYTVKIAGKQSVELHGVLVGDVWLCAGQSNMQFGLAQVRNAADVIKDANHPLIRFFVVGQRAAYTRVDVPRGSWKAVSPSTVGGRGGISAVAYFFARKLEENIHVPIGLVQDAVGGVPAETYTSPEGLRPLKDFDAGLAEVERRHQAGQPEYGNYINHWYDDYDLGTRAGANWADPALDDSSWKTVTVPGSFFRDLGIEDVAGLCWLRKEITLPATLPAGAARLYLGSVDKMDTTYINGHQVGASSWVENPRAYFARDGVLKPGRNVIAIRLFKMRASRGFLGKPEELHLTLGDGTVIPLNGEWKGKLSVNGRPPQPLPLGFENNPVMPSVLYNGMLAPIVPLSITGAIWYQGESNEKHAAQYRTLLPAMISDWRRLFGQGNFPFYIVSLPLYKHHNDVPVDDSWAEVREAQALAAKNLPNSCLAVTVDTGNPDNIHPIDKKEPGERLALCALGEHYGQKVAYSGPMLKSVDRLPGAIKLHFDHIFGGLVAKGGEPGEFAIAGEDRKWSWASARLEGDTITVSASSVPNPKEVRYAWQANPKATLFNGAGLPAAPFRTDNWPGIAQDVR
ncbi:MAG: sialate O-acetylesterase [Bryobacteraceae bacterium]